MMNKETRQFYRDLAYYSSIGLSVALSIFIGLGIGLVIDGYLGSAPVAMLIFLGLGIAAGFRNILLAIRRSQDL